jgi:hypothetical protein
MFIKIENFISDEFCDQLISSQWKNIHKRFGDTFDHGGRTVTPLDKNLLDSTNEDNQYINPIKILHTKILYTVKDNISSDLICNYMQFVEWNTNVEQPNHLDFNWHHATSILYLNDNFVGGETYIEDKIITPKKGTIIIFNGKNLHHGVNKIKEGTRYTISGWYISPSKWFEDNNLPNLV